MKKKILALCLIVALAAIAVTGVTLAYFTDTDTQTNTFTAGKVGINLDETMVQADEKDDLVSNGKRTDDAQSYQLHPGITVDKDPTITVDSDSLNTYVAAVVTIKGDLYDLIGIDGEDTIDIHVLASGGLLDDQTGAAYGQYNGLPVFQNDHYAVYQAADKENNTWTLYVFLKDEKAAGDQIVLFEQLSIPVEYDNAEMAKINGMSIDVKAYAAQTQGFADCYDAMTSAFDEVFVF